MYIRVFFKTFSVDIFQDYLDTWLQHSKVLGGKSHT